MKKTYRVFLTTTASTVLEVEAEDDMDAEDKAFELGTPSLCFQCAGWSGSGVELGDYWETSEIEEVE